MLQQFVVSALRLLLLLSCNRNRNGNGNLQSTTVTTAFSSTAPPAAVARTNRHNNNSNNNNSNNNHCYCCCCCCNTKNSISCSISPALTMVTSVSSEAEADSTTTTTTTSNNNSNSNSNSKGPLHPVSSVISDHHNNNNNNNNNKKKNQNRPASIGDIVTVRLSLTPEDGFVPEHLFDCEGRISLVLGWGNYLPGLHELLEGKRAGDCIVVRNNNNNNINNDNNNINNNSAVVSIDAGFGRRDPNLVIEVPKRNLKNLQSATIDKIKVGQTLHLNGGGIKVAVLKVTPDAIVVDANHPLAGSSYSCDLLVVESVDPFPIDCLEYCCDGDNVEEEPSLTSISPTLSPTPTLSPSPSPYKIATLAMGCFWGVELALMRTPGVVGTRAGYTQGNVHPPSYSEIREGTTGHREAVLVLYDERVVSYTDILKVYDERLAVTAPEYFKLDLFAGLDDDDNGDDNDNDTTPKIRFAGESQYRHGIYYHDTHQQRLAADYIASIKDSRYCCDVDLNAASVFYSADEHHQQYLYKGGQAARKGCREPIRCYG